MTLYRLEYIIDTFLKKHFGIDFEKPVIIDFQRIEKECQMEQQMLDLRRQNLHKIFKVERKSEHKIVCDDSEITKIQKLSKIKSNNLRKKYEQKNSVV